MRMNSHEYSSTFERPLEPNARGDRGALMLGVLMLGVLILGVLILGAGAPLAAAEISELPIRTARRSTRRCARA
jgi:hypothetical protein